MECTVRRLHFRRWFALHQRRFSIDAHIRKNCGHFSHQGNISKEQVMMPLFFDFDCSAHHFLDSSSNFVSFPFCCCFDVACATIIFWEYQRLLIYLGIGVRHGALLDSFGIAIASLFTANQRHHALSVVPLIVNMPSTLHSPHRRCTSLTIIAAL